MFIVAEPSSNPEFVAAIQRFRGRIYFGEGALALDKLATDGRHIEATDATAYHLVSLRDGEILGCLRYQQMGSGMAQVGGWAVSEQARFSRVGVELILAAVRLAQELGDDYATATATVRNNSAGILRRMGARRLRRYYDPSYGCEMELLEFCMSDFGGRAVAQPMAA